ncbi:MULTISPECIES: L-serine ammonia-lyase [unclassified Rhizobium]|jgi:L-serine dehydratase|nr:L-serine ammonia-lyase [Rhizobium sp. WW_1]RKD74069.1 L-serine dehydratase [Rhizobium sp. WW_1]
MFLSVFDVFKIGVGPSSSHTMGPMTAAVRFLAAIRDQKVPFGTRIRVKLYGSLAFTGRGHATDRAVALGLLGLLPADLDIDEAGFLLEDLQDGKTLRSPGLPPITFDPETDVVFDYGDPLPGHANGLTFDLCGRAGETIFSETYYSIGGGFVVTASEKALTTKESLAASDRPFPFHSAASMLAMASIAGISVAQMKRANELVSATARDLDDGLDRLWRVMDDCIERGLRTSGELPGGLKVKRRASAIYRQLLSERGSNQAHPHVVADWLSVYAMAVNEENAGGGRVVTAPTNGAAGVVPAVLKYFISHCGGDDRQKIHEFLLTAAAIGGLIKHNASISGAEAGCQGEVGSAAAMAAAGLCAVLGGTPAQVENAAEIALEHHLGLTCDPVAGLVQVPCIERNGMGAMKAVSAASLALRGDGTHFMPLDNCIRAMRQTGEEMNSKFKETSLGGLAVNLPEC